MSAFVTARTCSVSARLLAGAFILVALPAAAGAAAADAPPGQAAEPPQGPVADQDTSIADIVVTARKQAESIQKVPISVTAIPSDKLDSLGVTGIEDLFRDIPSVTVSSLGGNGTDKITIRGIYAAAGDPTTAVYINEIPLPQQGSTGAEQGTVDAALFDLDRVEVLRGPQGTLYGAGAEGGLVKYVTKAPVLDQWDAAIKVRGTQFDGGGTGYLTAGVVNVPLIPDLLAARATVQVSDDGGYINRVASSFPFSGGIDKSDVNALRRVSARLAFLIQPDDSLTIQPSIDYQHNRNGSFTGFFSTLPGLETDYRGTEFVHDDFLLSDLTIRKQFNFGSITNATSYYVRDLDQQRDYTGLVAPALAGPLQGLAAFGFIPPSAAGLFNNDTFDSLFTPRQKRVTEEFRVAGDPDEPLRWNVGVYYTHTGVDRTQTVSDPSAIQSQIAALGAPLVIPPIPGALPTGLNLDTTNFFQSKQYVRVNEFALFTDDTYQITDEFSASAGVRWFHNTRDQSRVASGILNGGTTVLPTATVVEESFTPRFSLNYQFTPDNLAYVSAARGYRSGGAQSAVPSAAGPPVIGGVGGVGRALAALGYTAAPISYNPDYLWSYEIGSKNQFANNRVRLNASAFWIDWSQIQQSIDLIDPLNGRSTGFSTTINGPHVLSRGGEVELQANVFKGLQVEGGAAYNDSTFTKNLPAAAGGTDPILPKKGDWVQFTPRATLSAGAEYVTSLAEDFEGIGRLDYQWRSSARRSFDRSSTDYHETGYHTINARFAVQAEKWSVSFFIDNITNARPVIDLDNTLSAPSLGGVNLETTLPPRLFGLEATAKL